MYHSIPSSSFHPSDTAETVSSRDAFFERIGAAFTQARGTREIMIVVEDPAVKQALDDLMLLAPAVTVRALEEIYVDSLVECVQAGTFDQEDVDKFCKNERYRVYEYAYSLFERGYLWAHLGTSIKLYLACGQLYSVCPMALARGKVAGCEDCASTEGVSAAGNATP